MFEADDSVEVHQDSRWAKGALEQDTFFSKECPVQAEMRLRVDAQVMPLEILKIKILWTADGLGPVNSHLR